MSDELFFNSIVTKSLEPVSSEERYFEGYLTVEVKDKQGEITIVDELYKVLPVWMDRGAPISDTHSNRIVGKGINFSRAVYKNQDGDEIPAIKITGKIHKNYELDNDIWEKIKSGEYKGLSFGGATKSDRTPKVLKDGSVAYALKDLEHYEVAVCKDPAVPLALITDFNPVAKAMADHTEDRDGKMVIKCSKFGCSIDKVGNSGKTTNPKRLQQVNDTLREMAEEEKLRETNDKVITDEEQAVKDKKVAPSRLTTDKERPNNKLYTDELMTEKADFANTGGDDASTMYNQDGGKQRPKSDTVVDDDDYMKVKANLNEYQTFEEKVNALVAEGKSRESAEKIVGSFAKRSNKTIGGEVPPQWTGTGKPYPNTDEKRVVKRKKVIKTESWHELRKEAFDLDMQWRVIELVNQATGLGGKGRKQDYYPKYSQPSAGLKEIEEAKQEYKPATGKKTDEKTRYYSNEGKYLGSGSKGKKLHDLQWEKFLQTTGGKDQKTSRRGSKPKGHDKLPSEEQLDAKLRQITNAAIALKSLEKDLKKN